MAHMTVEEMFPADGTITDHIASKEMWAGSIGRITSEELVAIPKTDSNGKVLNNGIYTLTRAKLSVSPALVKMFDEAVVNAADHVARMKKAGNTNPVTVIRFSITDSGVITLYNNGQGVPTDYHSVAKMYAPQLIFGEAFKGSNLKKETKLDIGGGTNGVGIKITNTHSLEFNLNTNYLHPKDNVIVNYKQKWEDGMKTVHPPVINIITGTMKSAPETFTEICFKPNYERFGYSDTNRQDMAEVKQLFIARMHMIASYVGWFSKSRTEVYINNKLLNVRSMKTMAEYMFADEIKSKEIMISTPSIRDSTVAKGASADIAGDGLYPWEFVVAISATKSFSKKNKDDFCRLSNVNSVVVNAGNHLSKFLNAIVKRVRETLASELKVELKTVTPAHVYKNIYLFMNCTIPDVVWGGGQTKESIQIDKKRIMQYNVPDNMITDICNVLRNRVAAEVFTDNTVTLSTEFSKTITSSSYIEKYDAAKFAGKRGTKACKQKVYLLIAEGDSARDMCKEAMMTKNPDTKKSMLDPDYYGMYTFGGNVINARKNIIHGSDGGKEGIDMSSVSHHSASMRDRMFLNDKLEKNKFFVNFIKMTGLKFDYKYDPKSPTFSKEYGSLNYDCIISCTDQDHDGVGKIFTQFANMIMLFWPNLINLEFIGRLETPSRRAYPKGGGKVLEFYEDYVCDEWIAQNPKLAEKYRIKYFKGLATNEKPEMANIFKNFHNNTLIYKSDKDTPELFEDHFGKDADKRKIILETPAVPPSHDVLELRRKTRRINFNEHLAFERKEFMFSDIIQKLWHQYDGFNEVGRKIVSGLLKLVRSNIVEKRVYQLGSYITTEMQYHHGDASINESIFSLGFTDVGGIQLPFVNLIGGSGSRAMGGADHGSPRYVFVVPNKKLLNAMYPHELIAFAKDRLEDGIPAEKEMLIGVIPRGICESVEIPSNGYKIKVHARDVFSVINNVRMNILRYEEGVPATCLLLNPYIRGFTGEMKPIRGKIHSLGKYTFDSNSRLLTITELPVRVWHNKYKEKLIAKKVLIKRPHSKEENDFVRIISGEIYNHSSSDEINIKITIAEKNNGWDPLDIIESYACEGYYDGFIGYFGLKKRMDDQLFMTRPDGSVETKYKSYSDVLIDWFPVAKHSYYQRVDRDETILELKIRCMRQHLRYITEYDSLGITKKETAEADAILSSKDYIPYNYKYLKMVNTRVNDAKEILHNVLEVDVGYDYLYATTDYMKHKAQIEKMRKKLAKLEKEYDDYLAMANAPPFKGARLWLHDLNELEKVCKEGLRTGWKYDTAEKYTY